MLDLGPLVLSVGFTYVFLTTIYNLFFHPLAKIPGPFLSRISNIPSFYHAFKGDRHHWTQRCLQIYGPKVRIMPNHVLFSDAEAYRDIYSFKSNVRRSYWYEGARKDKNDLCAVTITDVTEHARHRRVLNMIFTEQFIRSCSPVMQRHIDRWLELLGPTDTEQWSETRDMPKRTSALMFDMLGEMCYSGHFNTKEPGPNPFKKVLHGIDVYMVIKYVMLKSPLIDLIIFLKPYCIDWIFNALAPQDVNHYFNFVESNVTRRVLEEKAQEQGLAVEKETTSQTAPRKDMLHFIYAGKLPKSDKPALSHNEMVSEAHLLTAAGTDTTATTLCGLWYYITRHPQAYDKLVSEIRTTFSSLEEITYGTKLSSCVYLRACLMESLRIAPAIMDELPRTVLKGGTVVAGEYYPEGVIVCSGGWARMFDVNQYGDPMSFRPERWIADPATGVTEEDVKKLKDGCWPFSKGTGNCVGQNLAWLQLSLVVARTLWGFDVRRAEGESVETGRRKAWEKHDGLFHNRDALICIKEGPFCQFKRRQV